MNDIRERCYKPLATILNFYDISFNTMTKITGISNKALAMYNRGQLPIKSNQILLNCLLDFRNFKMFYEQVREEIPIEVRRNLDSVLYDFEKKKRRDIELIKKQLYNIEHHGR
jgi:hypothetical protein